MFEEASRPMSTMNAIVIASDLTARSDRPYDRAVRMAREAGARLVLVHAVEAGSAQAEVDLLARARASAAQLIRGLDIPVETDIEIGAAPEIIADAAERSRADLIVVGPARFNNIADIFLGTAVDHLVRCATVPVLVVKQRPGAIYNRLVVATDFSDPSAHALLTAAAQFPAAPITVVHGFQPTFPIRMGAEAGRAHAEAEARQGMTEFLARPDIGPLRPRITDELVEGMPAVAVARTADHFDVPLVVVGATGTSGFAQAVLGSRASDILDTVPCDVMVVRRKPDAG